MPLGAGSTRLCLSVCLSVYLSVCVLLRLYDSVRASDSHAAVTSCDSLYDEMGSNKQHEMKTDTASSCVRCLSNRLDAFLGVTQVLVLCLHYTLDTLSSSISVNTRQANIQCRPTGGRGPRGAPKFQPVGRCSFCQFLYSNEVQFAFR